MPIPSIFIITIQILEFTKLLSYFYHLRFYLNFIWNFFVVCFFVYKLYFITLTNKVENNGRTSTEWRGTGISLQLDRPTSPLKT